MDDFGWADRYQNILPTNLIRSPYATQYSPGAAAAVASAAPMPGAQYNPMFNPNPAAGLAQPPGAQYSPTPTMGGAPPPGMGGMGMMGPMAGAAAAGGMGGGDPKMGMGMMPMGAGSPGMGGMGMPMGPGGPGMAGSPGPAQLPVSPPPGIYGPGVGGMPGTPPSPSGPYGNMLGPLPPPGQYSPGPMQGGPGGPYAGGTPLAARPPQYQGNIEPLPLGYTTH